MITCMTDWPHFIRASRTQTGGAGNVLDWASRCVQRVIVLYPSFANCSQEGTDPWRVPDTREMMKRFLARDESILRKSKRLTSNELDLAAVTRSLDLTGLGGQFKSSDMQPASKATLRKRRKGLEGGDLIIEDTDEEAPSSQYIPSLGSQREASERQETKSGDTTAEDVALQGQRAELEHHTIAAAAGITRVSTPYIVSHRHMALFEDHQRKRPGIMTSSEMSDPEAENDPGPPRRHTRSRLQCEECGGANGLSRAWVFDVPLNQRRAYPKEDYKRTCTPGPVESLDSADDPSSSYEAVPRGALSAMTETRPPVDCSPTPPPEQSELEPDGADLSHQARVVCRSCESRYYINRSLPFRHRINGESEGMRKDVDSSEEDPWTVIREQSLHGLTDPAAWPERVRTHKLWPEFVSRKCLGPSPNDNFCWEDKDPASFYGPRCATHQSELAAGRVSLCGRHGCDEESMTWWTGSGAPNLRSQAPSLIPSGDRPSRTRGSHKVYKTPLCDDCEDEARDEGRCFTCTTRLAPDDLAGRCEACYSNTSLHRDWTKEIARWKSADGQITQLRAPWFLVQDHRDGNPL